jgi:RNA binding exosome subunit
VKSRNRRFGLPLCQHIQELRDTLDSRLDDGGNFFFRLDKQAAFGGQVLLTKQDDVIAVKGKVKAYPNNRENAMNALTTYLDDLLAA